jgi:hypothetical protein
MRGERRSRGLAWPILKNNSESLIFVALFSYLLKNAQEVLYCTPLLGSLAQFGKNRLDITLAIELRRVGFRV